MKRVIVLILSITLFILPSGVSSAKSSAADCKPIQQVFDNVKLDEGVCKVTIERDGLSVSYKGHKMSPEMMELEFSANFQKVGLQTVVMGEFALLQGEVSPVVDALRKGGFDVSAIHNHWMHEDPRIMYLHFQGTGDAKKLAQTVKYAISRAQSIKRN